MQFEQSPQRRYFPVLYHALVFAVWMFTLYKDITFIQPAKRNFGVHQTYGGPWKFLTFWNELINTFYFGIALLNDLCGSNAGPEDGKDKHSTLQKFRDRMYSILAFPIGAFVVASFWSLYAVDRELVYPAELDKIIPSWLNHVMHTTVLPFLLIEAYVVYHEYPSKKVGIPGIVFFSSLYQFWILWIAFKADIWVYPILRVLSWPMRIVFMVLCWVLVMILYLCGHEVTQMCWGPTQGKTLQAKKVK
ncbi:androgen-induced gene 1 protein-like isoform X1 [Lingula anatina]|uniref:Androgen-induced gene 1 protein-like isoform X1 n=1 Tax=Lingula anatina TaxID=7574 RepID=A0A1S3HCX2_LINAN|nr:androgen-induced gene 1 protein-like isoform X1 [Lingula anatina]|eukprot:XP_013383835.1 androgen-induced gene 1 protein-like isoform X1 [Lingula anatina]